MAPDEIDSYASGNGGFIGAEAASQAAEWRFLAPPVDDGPVGHAPPPTFSVVIAAHEVANLIGESVDSALRQTVPPAEIIVCDDGSTDDLDRVLGAYGNAVTVVKQAHMGVGAAKDTAARAASGDFVAILDADDIFLPERLEAMTALAVARPDLDLLTTDAWVEIEGNVIGRYTDRYIAFAAGDQRRRILERCFLFPLVAVRRESLLHVGGFDSALQSAVDWDLWIRLMLAGARAGCVDEPLAHYRIRAGSVTSNMVRRAQGHVRVLEKALANPLLEPADRAVLDVSLRERRRHLRLAQAEVALRHGLPDARRQVLSLAFSRDVPLPTRLKCAASALAPTQAARFLHEREQRVGKSRLGRPVPVIASHRRRAVDTVPTVTDVARVLRHAPGLRARGALWRALDGPYRRFLRTQSSGGGIARTIHGQRVRLRYPFGAIASSDYEAAGFAALMRLLEPDMTVFDIGASFGLYSLVAAAKVGGAGRVYAFEPTASAAAALRDHVEINRFEDRIQVVKAVVDERSGTVEFYEPRTDWIHGTNMMASLSEKWVLARQTFASETEVESFQCRAVSIDDFCAQIGARPDVLKIDVEGAEGRVLRGARTFLANKSGRILLETHPYALESLGDSEESVLAQLDDAGWVYEELERKRGDGDLLGTAQFMCSPQHAAESGEDPTSSEDSAMAPGSG